MFSSVVNPASPFLFLDRMVTRKFLLPQSLEGLTDMLDKCVLNYIYDCLLCCNNCIHEFLSRANLLFLSFSL